MTDKVVQLTDKDGNNIFPTTKKNITMTDVDPGEGSALAADNYVAVYGETSSLLDLFYPVGCFFETTDTTFNPNTAWGGAWDEDTSGRVLVARDSGTFATVGSTGGEEKHTLTVNEMPSHRHLEQGWYGLPDSSGTSRIARSRSVLSSDTAEYGASLAAGGGQSHNNLQPYMVVKRWHRVA